MSDVVKRLERHLRESPVLGRSVYIASGAGVLGDVTIGDFSSIWFNAVIRADINRIMVGHHTNIQDNAVLHVADRFPCNVGNYVTVGHSATVHACTVEDECLIGIGATILDGAVIGRRSLIGAHALVTPGTVIPPGSLVLGSPARRVRDLSSAEKQALRRLAMKYTRICRFYLRHPVTRAASRPGKSVPRKGQGVHADAHFPAKGRRGKRGSNDG